MQPAQNMGEKMDRIKNILPLDSEAMQLCREQWKSIAKPLNSLGLLESAVEQLAGIFGTPDVSVKKRTAVVMCADNGVVCEGVSQSDSSVTTAVARSIADGNSNINIIARQFGAETIAVDIGMNEDLSHPKIISLKCANGTGNIAEGAAMTTEQAEYAVCAGMNLVQSLKQSGTDIIITGEMGIGNTTTTAALASVLLELPPEDVTGRGAGLSSDGLQRKLSAVKRAVSVNKPDKSKPVELLAKLGGFDIAGMVGLFLGGAVYRVPIVIDGVISAVSAVLAELIAEGASDYALCSHVSREPAGRLLLGMIKKKPLITAELALGEGTGGAMLLPLLDAALAVYNSTHSFHSLEMERYDELI